MVSIIVPIFNAKPYLSRCLDSILSQTYTDLDVVLIDDGSEDGSGEICESYAQKDFRIKVIHQSNQGVSCARQKGLDTAIGDYIIHVDPDDWIEPDEIESLYYEAIKENADMVICDYWYETRDEKQIVSEKPQELKSSSLRKQIICLQLHGSCCNKLIKRELIKQVNCGFYPSHITYCEDILFNVRLLVNELKIVYVPKAFYHYNLANPSGVTMSFSDRKLYSWIDVVKELEKILNKEDKELLYAQKKEVLYVAFRLKKMHLLKQLYTEIHNEIIKQTGKYSWRTPKSSNLALALRGYPKTALLLFHIQMWVINTVRKIKKL